MSGGLPVRIREDQWLSSGEALFADCDGEECLVRLDSEVANHPSIDQAAESNMTIHTAREALDRAGVAATRAKARGSIDAFGRIAVFMCDLSPA